MECDEQLGQVKKGLGNICHKEHASCNTRCPVFLVNGGVPDSAHDFEVNRGCDCFKDGGKMAQFLKAHGVSSVDIGSEMLDLTEVGSEDTLKGRGCI